MPEKIAKIHNEKPTIFNWLAVIGQAVQYENVLTVKKMTGKAL